MVVKTTELLLCGTDQQISEEIEGEWREFNKNGIDHKHCEVENSILAIFYFIVFLFYT
jgi:hypothetical protein